MSGKTYKCPFCNERATREDLGQHIEEEHDECIPKGMTANQIVFNTINHKDHGTCVVCKRPTKWNETACKYDRLCGRPQCQKALRDAYKKNMLRVHGKTTLLDDPEQQEKMLANRRISGKYKFTDGGYHVFTGKYEEKALEFMDKVMGFKSTDILSPGPTIEYIYKGKKLKWITDILLIPFNLVIEVKDGGSNPNNREMVSYREKQLAKEQMITNMGKFNYLRLTDNDFSQLLGIVAELKAQMIDDSEENKKVIINVNEEVNMLQEKSLPLFFSEEDKCYNVDKWIDGKIDTLFICGMSGGGKSTTANIFADKYNGTVISLDAIYIYMLQMPSLRKKLLQYKNELKYIALFSKEEYGSETGILYSDDDKDEKGVKFIKFCSRYIKRPIFEGVQVARIYFKDNSIFEDAAILIKGTSTVTSLLRRVKRDKSGLSDIVYYMKSYYKHYKQQSKFMDSLDNDMLQEGTPIIFSEKDLVLNLDAWKNKELSVLYMVGLSGSGKSTLSEELSDEYDAHHIDTDKILWWLTDADSIPADKIPWRMEDWYGDTKVNTNIAKKVKSDKIFRKKLMEDYIKFIIGSNERFVIEGAFILDMYEYHSPLLNNAAFVIKGTSLTTSIIRRIKRDYGTPSLAMKRIPKIVNGYRNYISITNRMRDDMFEENLIDETVGSKFTKRYSGFNDLCKSIKTPSELNDWYNVNNIRWFTQDERVKRRLAIHSTNEDDVIVAWPDEIIKKHAGICLDHAIFMHLLCDRNSIDTKMLYIVAVVGNDKDTMIMGHIVCMYEIDENGIYIFNYRAENEGSIQGPFGSYAEAETAYKSYYSKMISMFLKMMPGKYHLKKVVTCLQDKNMDVYAKLSKEKYVTQEELISKIPEVANMFIKVNKECKPTRSAWLDDILASLDKLKLSNVVKAIKGLFSESAVQEANLIPIPKPKDIKYIQSGEGIMNPYIVYDGKQYRVRVETLVFNKQGDVLIEMQDPKNLNKYGTNYKLPGGGLDKGKSLDEQAEAECNEEALVVTKNMSYTGMTYFQSYDGKYPEWQKKKLWPLGLKYEGSLTFIFVAEYVKKYTGHIDDVDKDDFYQKAKYVGVDTIDWRAEHEEAIDFYFNHRDAIREGADMDLNEFAGPGGMTPAPDLSYVTQYGPVHRDTGTGIMDMNVEGYAVSNDILTKNILTQDKSGMVKKENTEEFLKGRKLRVFQFRSDPEGLRIIENAIGTVQPRGFIYEALTGKKLLSDDQILCDEACTEISPVDIGSEATSYLQTVAEQLKSIKGKKDHEFPLTNPHMIKEADAITEGLKDVVVMENQYGVYAKNAKTGMRTAYYQRIKDIPAKVVAKKNVKH